MAPRVLLVDDQQVALKVRKKLLEFDGCTVRLAPNSHACLEALEEFAVDVVILDYLLNDGLNGEELARLIRDRWPNISLIMLTGVMELPTTIYDVVDRVFIKGCHQPEEIVDAIHELAGNSQLRERSA